jgi:hypothetical protein
MPSESDGHGKSRLRFQNQSPTFAWHQIHSCTAETDFNEQYRTSLKLAALLCYIVMQFMLLQSVHDGNGRGGIRTHGGFPHARFRVECLKPDSATLPEEGKGTSNAERPTSNVECKRLRKLDVSRGGASGICRHTFPAGRILCVTAPKNVTILGLPWLPGLLHIVCPRDSHAITCC